MVVVSVWVLVSELMENLVSGCINLVLKGLLFTSWFVFENSSVGQKKDKPKPPSNGTPWFFISFEKNCNFFIVNSLKQVCNHGNISIFLNRK